MKKYLCFFKSQMQPWEMKNQVSEMRSHCWHWEQIRHCGRKASKPAHIVLEIIQNEAQEGKDWREKTEFDLINLWDKIKQSNMYIIRVLGEKGERAQEKN